MFQHRLGLQLCAFDCVYWKEKGAARNYNIHYPSPIGVGATCEWTSWPPRTLSVRQCLAPLWPIVTLPNTYCTKRVRDSSTILFWIATRNCFIERYWKYDKVCIYIYIRIILYIYNMCVCDYRGNVHKNHCKIHFMDTKEPSPPARERYSRGTSTCIFTMLI